MKIITLTAENFKRLSVVEITPDGNLVQISGKNASGKTSVLDAMWAALGGAGHIQAVPVRRGATEARIKLDMGELIVTRTFRSTEGGVTTQIKVENAEGFRPGSPQKMLDGLLGSLSFDPLAFTRMEPRQQFDALRRFVPDVDFDALDAADKTDYQQRTDINRQAKEARTAAQQMVVPSELPAEQIDEAALTQRLAAAGEHNASIETRKERRERAREKIAEHRATADVAGDQANQQVHEIQARTDRTVEELKAEIARLEKRIDQVCEDGARAENDIVATAMTRASGLRKAADELEAQLAEAPALPDPIDTAALTAEIADARRINDGIRQRNQRNRQIETADGLEARSKALTERMAERAKRKSEAIAAAALPIPGLGLGAGVVMMNGLPFDQASDAEQLRASIAIAMASNPKLRVIRVRDGSLLDEDGMKLLAQMADEADCQVWIETVSSDDKVGFVLEDGRLKSPAAKAPAASNTPDLLAAT